MKIFFATGQRFIRGDLIDKLHEDIIAKVNYLITSGTIENKLSTD